MNRATSRYAGAAASDQHRRGGESEHERNAGCDHRGQQQAAACDRQHRERRQPPTPIVRVQAWKAESTVSSLHRGVSRRRPAGQAQQLVGLSSRNSPAASRSASLIVKYGAQVSAMSVTVIPVLIA